MVITFDFDSTLTRVAFDPEDGCFSRPAGPNLIMVQCLKAHISNGNDVHVVTSRVHSDDSQKEIEDFLMENGIKGVPVHHTGGKPKRDTLKVLLSRRHHDDDQEELDNLPFGCEGLFVPNGWLDENGKACDPDDPRFHFDNWSDENAAR